MHFPAKSEHVVAFSLVIAKLSVPARGSQIANDGFGPSFPIYANSGSGFGGAWAQGGFNAFASGYVSNDRSLCYPQLETSGGSVSGAAFDAINGTVRPLARFLGANGTTAYLSFLIQPNGTLNDGIFDGFFGVTLNGSAGNDVFVGKPGGGAEERYVIENRGGAGQIPSLVTPVVGRTTLLVVKVQFLAGNDLFTLYVNPTPGRPEPSSTIVKSDVDLGVVSKIGIYSTGAFTVDEIRIGTTFADVTPQQEKGSATHSEGCFEDAQ